MRTSGLVVAALIVSGLVVLAVQNLSPALPLVFLGVQSIPLPLGVWLSGAIALGALTTLAIATLANINFLPSQRPQRRRWTVRSEPSSRAADRNQRQREWFGRSPQEAPRRDPPQEPQRDARAHPSVSGQRYSQAPSRTVAVEDWQAWEKRVSPSQWEDWSQASSNEPIDENLSRRQRQDRQKAEATIHDLGKGWDDSAQETVYVAPGGSNVEDTLDDIEDGWEDWDSDDNPLADTAYAQRYEGSERRSRQDRIYAPPDDTDDDYADWENTGLDNTPDTAPDNNDDEGVYDADYRVIVPPYRPYEDEEDDGDRAP